MGRVIIVGDAHIGRCGGKRHRRFASFLDFVKAQKPKALLLAGDIFEFMHGNAGWVLKKYPDIFDKLKNISASGTAVYYAYGNHDFCFNIKDLKLNSAPMFEKINIAGKNFFFSHGDGVDPSDTKYHFLKKVLRSKITQLILKLTPDNILYPLAGFFSSISRKVDHAPQVLEKRSKAYKDYALDLLKKGGLDAVVLGHTHVAELCRLSDPGRVYVNPGYFGKDHSYAIIENDNSVYIGVFDKGC